MDSIQAFGLKIKELRGELDLSQEKLSELCELDRTYINGIERGRRNPSLKNILKIAAALQVHPSKLFDSL